MRMHFAIVAQEHQIGVQHHLISHNLIDVVALAMETELANAARNDVCAVYVRTLLERAISVFSHFAIDGAGNALGESECL